MRKRALGFTFTLASITSVVVACSSDDTSIPPVNNDPQDSGAQTPQPDGGALTDASDAGHDASKDTGSDAKPIDAPEVSLKYGSCSPFTACGGNPQGTWRYATGGCVEDLAFKECPTLAVKSTDFKIRGIVEIGATTLSRESEANLSATVNLPAACTGGLSCAIVAIGLKNPPGGAPGFDTATCTAGAASSCDCDVTKAVVDKSETTYTVAGNTITTADQKSYDFCVTAPGGTSTFTYEDELGGLAKATFVMTK